MLRLCVSVCHLNGTCSEWKELPELESCRHINGVRIDARILYATYVRGVFSTRNFEK